MLSSDYCALSGTRDDLSVESRDSAPLTFFSLPREIRNKVYKFSLVMDSPIVVWKGQNEVDYSRDHVESDYHENHNAQTKSQMYTDVIWRSTDRRATFTSLRHVEINLLLCSKALNHEAASMFYAQNTFSFIGPHQWSMIVSWLKTIGIANLKSLRTLEIDAYQPELVFQDENGQRSRHGFGFPIEEIFPQNRYLRLPSEDGHSNSTLNRPFRGLVASINPAVENFFVILGQAVAQKKVTIIMRLERWQYPGARNPLHDLDQCPEYTWFGMDLPNLMEIFRSLHAQHAEVLWKGEACRQELEEQSDIMVNLGWQVDISLIEEDTIRSDEPDRHPCHWTAMNAWRMASFVLRRRPLAEPPQMDVFRG